MRRLLMAALAATAACGSGGFQVPGPHRASARLDRDAILAIAEALRFEDARRYDAAIFDRLAADSHVEVRRRAALAAGRTGDPAAAPLLVRVLDDDPSPGVRADAAFALGELGEASPLVLGSLREAVPPGWVPVRPAQVPVVVEVLGALAKLGSPRARSMVEDALREAHPGRNAAARRVAAEALLAVWRFDEGEGRVLAAARYLDSPDPELRWRAAYALMRIGAPETAPHLLPLLNDEEHRVRAHAARGLSAVVADSAGLRREAVGALVEALADDHPHVRINAVRSLAGYGDEAPIEAMAELLHDEDANVAIAAAGALGAVGPAASTALVAFDPRQAPLGVRTAILRERAAFEPAATIGPVRRLVEGGQRERYAAARILPVLGWTRGREILERLVRDDDPRVAVGAVVSAGAMAADSALDPPAREGLRRVLVEAARDGAPRVRVAALGALGPLLQPDDLPAILDAYAAATTEPTFRPGALAAIQAVARLDSLRPGAADSLFTRYPPPADRWLRRAAARLGDGWGAAPPAVADEEGASYVDIVRRYIAGPLEHGHRPRASIETDAGTIVVQLLPEEAPLTVHNFITLARSGFFDHGVWHRVVPNFVLQDGAPAGDPDGGPGTRIRDEINRVRYLRGTVGMALAGPDTGGSQWFITHSPQPHLDGGYTVFGTVVDGMAAADAVVEGAFLQSIRIDG